MNQSSLISKIKITDDNVKGSRILTTAIEKTTTGRHSQIGERIRNPERQLEDAILR